MPSQVPPRINIVLRDQTGGEVHFQVPLTAVFHRILSAWCKRKNLDIHGMRLLFDGQKLKLDATPGQMDMGDGDVIDVVMEQIGGA